MKYLKKYNENIEEFIDIDYLKDIFLSISDDYKVRYKSKQLESPFNPTPELTGSDKVKKMCILIKVPRVYYSQVGYHRAKCRDLDDLILYSEKLHDLLLDIRVAKLRLLDRHPNCKIKVEHSGEYHMDDFDMSEIAIKISLVKNDINVALA
jgi:hypothetical protein